MAEGAQSTCTWRSYPATRRPGLVRKPWDSAPNVPRGTNVPRRATRSRSPSAGGHLIRGSGSLLSTPQSAPRHQPLVSF